jgi:hypothetical protein
LNVRSINIAEKVLDFNRRMRSEWIQSRQRGEHDRREMGRDMADGSAATPFDEDDPEALQ